MVTIDYTPGSSAETQTFTGTALDSVTGESGALIVDFTVLNTDTTTVSVSDDGGRVWTPVSNNGSVAVFTATA